jgi:hypothetical protein
VLTDVKKHQRHSAGLKPCILHLINMLGMMMVQTTNPTVKCGTHGTVNSAVVCCHLLQKTERVLGFIENSSEPDDLQAWCGACEEFFLYEGEMTEAFRAFNNFSLVCEFCYANIKQQHSANP